MKGVPGRLPQVRLVFEPPGDIHTLITENEEVVTLFILGGSLQYFDEDNHIVGQDDIYTVLKKYRDFCVQNGIQTRDDYLLKIQD